MRAQGWGSRAFVCLPLVVIAAGLSGCKTLSERYIALEVWKYERCFGHLPPGFVPPGGAGPQGGPPGRICGEAAACQPAMESCDSCQGGGMVGSGMAGGGMMGGGMVSDGMIDGGVRVPAGAQVPLGPGGSPGPTGVTSGRPIVISDEVVMP